MGGREEGSNLDGTELPLRWQGADWKKRGGRGLKKKKKESHAPSEEGKSYGTRKSDVKRARGRAGKGGEHYFGNSIVGQFNREGIVQSKGQTRGIRRFNLAAGATKEKRRGTTGRREGQVREHEGRKRLLSGKQCAGVGRRQREGCLQKMQTFVGGIQKMEETSRGLDVDTKNPDVPRLMETTS